MSTIRKREENGYQRGALRNSAEVHLAGHKDLSVHLRSKTPQDLINELQVHQVRQIELEMQNIMKSSRMWSLPGLWRRWSTSSTNGWTVQDIPGD
jgi:hypothetical protein